MCAGSKLVPKQPRILCMNNMFHMIYVYDMISFLLQGEVMAFNS